MYKKQLNESSIYIYILFACYVDICFKYLIEVSKSYLHYRYNRTKESVRIIKTPSHVLDVGSQSLVCIGTSKFT